MSTVPTFNTLSDAMDWMYEEINDTCVDNYRSALISSEEEMEKYEEIRSSGCCGSFDELVLVDNQEYFIGCNYGH